MEARKHPLAELRRRAVAMDLAASTAGSPHGPCRLSNSPALAIALPNALLGSIGLASLAPTSRLNPSNRRIRTRTYGGVGGVELRSSPYPDLSASPASGRLGHFRHGVPSGDPEAPARVHAAQPGDEVWCVRREGSPFRCHGEEIQLRRDHELAQADCAAPAID